MSILIKGMSIPQGAEQIWIDVWGFQGLLAQKIVNIEEIVEIPTPHGRLVDESDLTDELTELNDLNLENIAPTIIEAEE